MTTEQMDWLDDERRRREDDERAAAQLRRAATGQRATAVEPDRDATQDKAVELFMRQAQEARWAGSEPIERDAHEGCECLIC